MKRFINNIFLQICATILAYTMGLSPQAFALVLPETTCSQGVGVPPFLEVSVDSNLLLMIDNSGSMNDPAYLDKSPWNPTDSTSKPPACYDETYNQDPTGWAAPSPPEVYGERTYTAVSKNYEGLFARDKWYIYNFTSNQFEVSTSELIARGNCSSTYEVFDNSDMCVSVDTSGATQVVKGFAALGNFLNWAAASKFDIEKKILTGGKYNTTNNQLVMEHRGCMEKRMVKKVKVTDGTDDFHLTLAVKPTDNADIDEDGDVKDYTTVIEIFEITTDGVKIGACAEAVEEWNSGNYGQVTQKIQDCMEYKSNDKTAANSQSAYNHTMHACWLVKDGEDWTGQGYHTSIKNACANVYKEGVAPATLTSSDRGYICYGDGTYGADGIVPAAQKALYVGECAIDSTGWLGYWSFNSVAEIDNCIIKAITNYCDNEVDMPEIIDPSDGDMDTASSWNLPNVLMDSAVSAQLGDPIATMTGHIDQATAPTTGLIQTYAYKLRLGVMAFNEDGADTECDLKTDSDYQFITKVCDSATKTIYDGAQVLVELKKEISPSTTHLDNLVTKINDIQANSWTPVAESMLSAIGYYGQWTDGTDSRRLNATPPDYVVGNDPVEAWCQRNHVLIITDGASTTDIAEKVKTFVNTYNDGDAVDKTGYDSGTSTSDTCQLFGSTWLDDLTYFAANAPATDIYNSSTTDYDLKQNITTHIVVAGELRRTDTNVLPDVNDYTGVDDPAYITALETARADECSPDNLMYQATNDGETLYQAADISLLQQKIEDVFIEIATGSTAGSAASVISSSRGGEGAVYQALFWQEYANPDASTLDPAEWVGEIHSLLVDENGHFYEDTNPGTGKNGRLDAGDKRVIMFYDDTAGLTRVCRDGIVDQNKDCCKEASYDEPTNTCSAIDGEITKVSNVSYLWSATEWLSAADVELNRSANATYYSDGDGAYISAANKRHIFTWNDLDNNGAVDQINEMLPFTGDLMGQDWETPTLTVSNGRGEVVNDFGAHVNTDADADKIVNWIRGDDTVVNWTRGDGTVAASRQRQAMWDMDKVYPNPTLDTQITWRLGDVVHSTPMVVSRPAEGYHILYKDASYADFTVKWNDRRTMVYFGANDGMLHAVNGGFYNVENKMFCRTPDCNVDPSDAGADAATGEVGVSTTPELGAEMWAYVPYNLTPHLKCLMDTGYGEQHKYYVDLRPRMFDVKIFTEEAACATDINDPACLHPGGWGTILVGGMRFGGAPIKATDLNSVPDDRVFTSAYFIFDITNPERPPQLLSEFTKVDSGGMNLGYTTSITTMVPMIDSATSTNEWYLILGTGPTDVDGNMTISQTPKVAVVPLNRLVSGDDMRIPDSVPSSPDEFGRFDLGGDPGYVSDLVTVDYDLSEDYKADAVYFGTVEYAAAATRQWQGSMYRLVTNEEDNTGKQLVTTPSIWPDLLDKVRTNAWSALAPAALTNPLKFADVNQPIVSAANVATDGYNYWIYFGTGRFYNKDDKSNDDAQYYYGIKEPQFCASGDYSRILSWDTIEDPQVLVSDINTHGSAGVTQGSQGLWDVSKIKVTLGTTPATATVSCTDATTDCLPTDPTTLAKITNFQQLVDYIAGTGCGSTAAKHTGTDGWYRLLDTSRERNLGQATLLGGLTTFTTYVPYADQCKSEGEGYLYVVYYQTGTAYYKSIVGYDSSDDTVFYKKGLGRGLSPTPNLHVGKQGVTAVLQTSTGEIIGIAQDEQAIQNIKTGKSGWVDCTP